MQITETFRVLQIEDHPPDATMLVSMLEESRYSRFDVDVASTFGEGVQAAKASEYDVVALDLNLPDNQGLDTFTNFRKELPEVPVVVLTGLDDEALGIAAVRQGGEDYLVKGDFSREMLEHSLRFAIERYRFRKGLPSPRREQEQADKT